MPTTDPSTWMDNRPDPYQDLALFLCLDAVDDYIHGRDKDKNEAFILSDVFSILSGGADGKAILDRLDAMEEKPKQVRPRMKCAGRKTASACNEEIEEAVESYLDWIVPIVNDINSHL